MPRAIRPRWAVVVSNRNGDPLQMLVYGPFLAEGSRDRVVEKLRRKYAGMYEVDVTVRSLNPSTRVD